MRYYCKIIGLLLLTGFLSTQTAVATNADAELARAQQLLQNGQATEAFTLLDALESQLSDNLSFNYLHGLAALDSGQPGIAIFSLQRASLQDPAFAGARLELARAYYATGNFDRAEREFEQLLILKPPAEVEAVIDRYLAAGKLRRKQYSPSASLRLAAIAGYDSNANSGLDRTTVPGLLLAGQAVELPEANRETRSAFHGGSLKLTGQLPINAAWRMSATISSELKNYSNASQVDSFGYGVQAGADYSRENFAVTSQLSTQQQSIGDDIDYDSNRAAVAVLYQLSDDWLLRSGIGYGQLRFNSPLKNRDVNQQDFTVSAHRFFTEGWLSSVALSSFLGRDRRPSGRDADSEDWSRKLLGLQLAFNVRLSSKWQLSPQVTAIQADFDDSFGLSAASRRDLTRIYGLGLKRQQLLCTECSLTLAVNHLNQSSNDPRFDFDSTNIALSMERSF